MSQKPLVAQAPFKREGVLTQPCPTLSHLPNFGTKKKTFCYKEIAF